MSYLLNYKNWRALYENQLAVFEEDKDKNKGVETAEELPKDLDKRIKYLVDKAVDADSAAVKNAGKDTSYWVRPWDAIMDWMFAKGDPGKETEIVKRLIQYTPNYEKKIEDAKPTMKKEDIARCMEHWHGIFNDEGKTAETTTNSINRWGKWTETKSDGKNPQVESAIVALTKLSDSAFVDKLIDKKWKNADYYPDGNAIGQFYFPNKFKILGKDFTFNGADMQFDKEKIVAKSKILLDKLTATLKKTGKSPRVKLDILYTKSDDLYTTNDDNSLFLLPKLDFNKELSAEEKNKLGDRQKVELAKKQFSTDATASFFIWYTIISNDDLFGKLTQNLDNPTYVKTDYVKMTEQDKINIINGITEAARAKWGKSSWISPEAAIYFATSIMWWPTKAQETMPKTIVVTPASPGTDVEYENEWDFSWPYSKGQGAGSELAMTYFKSSQAVIQDGKEKEIDNAVKQILAEIASKNGKLSSLTYRVVASTSDEPTNYISFNKLGSTWSKEANDPLVKDRAKVIEDALISSITANGIDRSLVIKSGEDLFPNNTLGGTAVYQEKKWMRNGTPQQKAEYDALFAKAKHSGILFNVKYITIEKEKSEPTPEETRVSDYEVVGEWLFQITWAGDGGYKKKKRRTRTRRPIRGINWDSIFPASPDLSGFSVKDLCDAYG